jgi:hypothetical protein
MLSHVDELKPKTTRNGNCNDFNVSQSRTSSAAELSPHGNLCSSIYDMPCSYVSIVVCQIVETDGSISYLHSIPPELCTLGPSMIK